MSCPICVSPEGTAITEGIRAGAGVLIVVTAIIIGAIARFAYRLWTSESHAVAHSAKVEGAHDLDGTALERR